jgi:biotin carboxyl carrier protein
LALRILLLLLVAATGWFYWDARLPGLPLTAWQVERYLQPAQPPHRIQAALRQLSGPHPGLANLRAHPLASVRAEAARLSPAVEQLEDRSPWVRFRAALALERNEPIATRPVLLAALRASPVFAEDAGALQWRLAEGARVEAGEELGSLDARPFAAPIPGRLVRRYVPTGEAIRPGQRLADVALADEWQVAALAALGRIGLAIDADELRLFQSERYPPAIQQAAAAAVEKIQSRPRRKS